MEKIDLRTIKPAAYNPRVLMDNAAETLKQSIRELGCIKPIIVNAENRTIIAGHQRTKTMLELGISECYGFVLSGLNVADEMRFNQLHNRCEYEVNDNAPIIRVSVPLKCGLNRVSAKDVQVISRGKLGVLNNILCRLLMQYGEFGMPVCDKKGNIKISGAYAFASKLLSQDMYVYCLDDDKMELALKYFSRNYGEFNYDMLEKKTYIQGFAQMKRLRNGKKGEGASMHSSLYEEEVIPYLKSKSDGKSLRILDFGAGQKDYVKKLQKEGYNIFGCEPYHRVKGTNKIAISDNKRDFLHICRDLTTVGKYDVVICDSVLNSVDSIQAENAVVLTCLALCKIGGKIFISGRPLESQAQRENNVNGIKAMVAYANFFDENNFSAIYRNGEWFYQKFHSEKQRKELLEKLGGVGSICYAKKTKYSFHIIADNVKEPDVQDAISALQFEFNLPLPNGKRYGLHEQIKKAYEYAISTNS